MTFHILIAFQQISLVKNRDTLIQTAIRMQAPCYAIARQTPQQNLKNPGNLPGLSYIGHGPTCSITTLARPATKQESNLATYWYFHVKNY